MVDDNIPATLVLEDDCLPEDDLPDVLGALLAHPVDRDVVHFIDKDKVYRKNRPLGPLIGGYKLTRMVGTPEGPMLTF